MSSNMCEECFTDKFMVYDTPTMLRCTNCEPIVSFLTTTPEEFPFHITHECTCTDVEKPNIIEHVLWVRPRDKDRLKIQKYYGIKPSEQDCYDSIYILVCDRCADKYPPDTDILVGWDTIDACDGIPIDIKPYRYDKD